MKFLKIKNLVGAVAPSLGAAMGGPLGGAAGKIIAGVLGCEPSAGSIEKAMQEVTPDQLAEIKRQEAEFEAKMKSLDVDLFALQTADIQDARKYFAKDWTPRIIAITLVAGFLGYIFMITVADPEDNPLEIINLVLGWLGGTTSAIISFYFGASNTKDDK